MNNKNSIICGILSLLGIVTTLLCSYYDYINFALIIGTISVMLVILTIKLLICNRNDESVYKSSIRNILRTYDSVLVAVDELPNLKEKNIVVVGKIYDLLDAQVEVKKPIYYKSFDDHTVFILIENDEACVSIIKQHQNIPSSFELALSEIRDEKNSSGIDRRILEELENTTIIRLDNDKEIKISPIRKKEPIVIIPKNAMISKDRILLSLKDDSKTSIELRSIKELSLEYNDDKTLEGLAIITNDEKYILKSVNEKKMTRLKEEISKKI